MLGKGGLLDVRIADEIIDAFFRIIEVPEDLHPVRVCQNLKISRGTIPTGIRSIEKTVQIVLNVFLFHYRLLFWNTRIDPSIRYSWFYDSLQLAHITKSFPWTSIRKITMFKKLNVMNP